MFAPSPTHKRRMSARASARRDRNEQRAELSCRSPPRTNVSRAPRSPTGLNVDWMRHGRPRDRGRLRNSLRPAKHSLTLLNSVHLVTIPATKHEARDALGKPRAFPFGAWRSSDSGDERSPANEKMANDHLATSSSENRRLSSIGQVSPPWSFVQASHELLLIRVRERTP